MQIDIWAISIRLLFIYWPLAAIKPAILQTTLDKIQNWYRSNCKGDWEHSFGVQIDTIDNPGWRVKKDLTAIEFESKVFNKQLENGEND